MLITFIYRFIQRELFRKGGGCQTDFYCLHRVVVLLMYDTKGFVTIKDLASVDHLEMLTLKSM